MLSLQTENFGELTYEESEILHFPSGLPGYPDDNQFLLIEMEDTRQTFFWLQSVDDGDTCFPIMDVSKALPDYDPSIETSYLEELGDINNTDFTVYNIAVIPDDLSQTRVNLRAPVVINMTTRTGKQLVCNNEEYAVRHYIMEELKANASFEGLPC